MERVQEAARIFEEKVRKPIRNITKLSSITNDNFLINSDKESYVVRLPKLATGAFIDRDNEKVVLSIVKGMDLKTIYFSEISGIRITLYQPTTTYNLIDQLAKIAKTLKKLHRLRSKKLMQVRNFHALTSYMNLKEQSQGIIGLKLYKEVKVLEFIKNELATSPITLCHNDLVATNILLIEDQIKIIDYEYAALNHPFFDLMSLITENNVDDEENQKLFLESYFEKAVDKQTWYRLQLWGLFLDSYWFRWAMILYYQTKDENFKAIAAKKYNRYSILSRKLLDN